MGTGHTPDRTKAEYWQDVHIPWVTAADLSKRLSAYEPLHHTEQHVSELGVANSAAVVHPPGTVMLCRTASVGLFCQIGRPMATTQAFVTWTPRAELDPRYLLYVIGAMRPEWDRLAYGSTHLTIYFPDLADISIPVPPKEEQRRIAEFLDDRVSRIDRIIAARREQIDKADGLLESQILMDLVRPSDVWAPLRRLGVAVTTGPFGTVFAADEYVDAGVPMINPSHIQNGEILPDDKHSVSPETARRLSRHALRRGDLVVSRKGDIGRTAMVHAYQDGWLCGSDSIALHTTGTRVSPDALALLLTTSLLRKQLLSQSNAATMPSLNEGNLLSLEVPVVTHDEQAFRTAQAWKSHRSISNFKDMANGSIALLTEYKSSLITAAVTGELDVSTAGSSIPG